MSKLVRTIAVATIAATALIAGVLASPSAAFHIPGAAYSGTIKNLPYEGKISFSVSGDGSSITNYRLTDVRGSGCRAGYGYEDPNPIPITNHTFSKGGVHGSFPDVQLAQGNLDVIPGVPCPGATGIWTWSATTSASPAGSEECLAAQAQVKNLKKSLGKAKKTGNQAKIKKLQKKLKKAKNYRNQVCA